MADILTPEQKTALAAEVGSQAAKQLEGVMERYEAKAKETLSNTMTKEQYESFKATTDAAVSEVKEIVAKQGKGINDIMARLENGGAKSKSIAEVLQEDETELKKIYQQGSGTKTYMLQATSKGFIMNPFDTTANKTVGPVATVSGVNSGTAGSIAQSIDAASLLRIAGDAPILSQYRNTRWIFDLVNLQNSGFNFPFALWYEEVAKDGTSATVAEGALKPLVQYKYIARTASYKKEAMLIGFTEEFSLDFPRLQDDILNKGRVDVINRINAAVLANLITSATAYNTATSFKPGGTGVNSVADVNDYDAIAAMAAQVENATLGAMANAAVTSTFKKYRMGINKSTTGEYLNAPKVLDPLAFVGNPAMAADDVLVGDFKQYNIILRGGLLVKVGYNGTDFAQNMFSVVIEQYYFDYISSARTAAIVKGPDFATVKAAISA